MMFLAARGAQDGTQALRGDRNLFDRARHRDGVVDGSSDGAADPVDAALTGAFEP
jgi:hypothetical protein